MASRVASAVQLFSLPLLHYLSGMRRLSPFWMLPNGVNTHTEDIHSDIVAIFTGNSSVVPVATLLSKAGFAQYSRLVGFSLTTMVLIHPCV
jgi:hypothetical protein